ncbi:hypothetical protein O181_023698 [Austropuccinia psidii MF-1]|uniref:Uncharacterized protein n=1 Tax=Austropuccinia psidii MF-1 TaxID=1389203 RepID=A0A9Q3GXI6_9BASI|nr:hypothetical protein [Austropuccinia psidii MF-1]
MHPLPGLPWLHYHGHAPLHRPDNHQWSPTNNYNLWTAPEEEEKINCLCHSLPLKYFKEGSIGLSMSPEKIPIWQMRTRWHG